MTREEAKELSIILKAFSEGSIIEYLSNDKKWKPINNLIPFINAGYNFRIKPEPKLVPFTFEDNLLFGDRWVRTKGNKPLCKFCNITEFGVKNSLGTASYSQLLKDYEFDDGSPCGKYIE